MKISEIRERLTGIKDSMQIRAVCASETGLIREKNEDNFAFDGVCMPQLHRSLEKPYMLRKNIEDCLPFAVLDGMGGECAGELASFTGAEWLASHGKELELTREGLTKAALEMNRLVYEAGRAGKYRLIGSTLSMLAFADGGVWICNLGDSPIYLCRDGALTMLGELHTEAEYFRQMGITGRKPGLTQFLGICEEEFVVEPYVAYLEIRQGDLFLICSDGLTDMVSESGIAEILSANGKLPEKMNACMRKALEAGGRDNITMILCEVW